MTRAVSGVSVVVPLFDEEENVEALVAELVSVLGVHGYPWELILVDDGSRDETRKRALEAVERNHHTRLVALARNLGQSAALLAGVRAARMSHVAMLDGDLQNDPRDLPRLLARAGEFDVVIGRRKQRRDRLMRRFASQVANAARRAVLRDGASDTGCSLKVFPTAAFLALPSFDGMHRFLPALFRNLGLTLDELDVNHRPRRAGISKYSNLARLRRGLLDLLGVWWLSRRALRVELDDRDS